MSRRSLVTDTFGLIDTASREMRRGNMCRSRIWMSSTVVPNSLSLQRLAGDGLRCASPGVGYRPRVEQPQVFIGGIQMSLAPPNTREEVEASTWNTRAWTYQE